VASAISRIFRLARTGVLKSTSSSGCLNEPYDTVPLSSGSEFSERDSS